MYKRQDLLIASTLASLGIAMVSLPLLEMVGTLLAAVVFALMVDIVKVPVFKHLGIA